MEITSKNKKEIFKILSIATIKITITGIVIGVFHEYDFWLFVLFSIRLLLFLYKNYYKATSKNKVLIFGMIITGVIGVFGELWGIINGYWQYHDLTNDRQFPYWVPLLWMFSFRFIYKLKFKLIHSLQLQKMSHKVWLALPIVFIFPTYGEIITIYLGVWTYSWPYQFFGVPLLAIVGLVVLHMIVHYILEFWVRKKGIDDIVFTEEK